MINMIKNRLLARGRSTSMDSLEQKIAQSVLEHVFSLTTAGALTSVFCGTIVLINMLIVADTNTLQTKVWYGLLIGLSGLRLMIIHYFKRTKLTVHNLNFWRGMFILATFAGGACWGLAGVMLMPYSSYSQQALIMFMITAVAAGAVPMTSGVLSASYAYTFASLIPIFLTVIFESGKYFYGISVCIAIYMIYLVIIGRNTSKLIINSITFKFENDDLLKNLSTAKNQLEVINSRLQQSALHDSLTQLANRMLFQMTLKSAIHNAILKNKNVGLLYIDLDRFKPVNDQYGHHAGDHVLVVVAERLRDIFGSSDCVARLGGDEFAIIVEQITDKKELLSIAHTICLSIAKPIRLDNNHFVVTASVGISMCPYDGTDIESLLLAADKSMYTIKQKGGNSFLSETKFVHG